MKKFLSIILAILMVVTMLPMAVMPASAATEAAEVTADAFITYSSGVTQYVKHNNYLYKVAYTNLKIESVDIGISSYEDLRIYGTTNRYCALLLAYRGSNAKSSNLPTSPGKSVSFYTADTYASNEKKPVVTVTCMAVNEPVWSWSDSSATAAFTSTDGGATMTVDAAIEISEKTAENCLETDTTAYTATATANGKEYTNVKTIYGEQGPHNFEYIKSGDYMIGSCTNGCGMTCTHNWTDKNDYLCDNCGFECAHENITDGICDSCGYNSAFVVIDGTLGGKTTATEDDVNTLVEQLKGYVDSGITTIIVTGSEPALYNFYGIDTSAVSAALYYLADGRSDSPYCGTIDLILPDVTEIVDDEFNNTFALNSITLPKVTTVGDGAFYATTFLQTLTFGSVITFVNEKNSGPFHMDGYEVGGCDLVLNCGQLQAEDKYKPNFETNVWFIGDWSGEYEWKSITLTHTGGEATCVAKAVCETCGEEYGDIDATAHSWANLDGICANGCGATCAHENQTGETCEICGAELHICDFSGEWKYDADKHWKECDCGLISEEGTHTGGEATCTAKAVCDICGESYGEVDKTNHDETVAYVNGFCPNCDAFEPAKLVDGVYEISNAGNLYWFADKVTNENATYGSADAILTCDIRVNEGTMTEASTGARVWTPIGKLGFIDNKRVYYPYTGTFDGQGNTVSGLYFNDTSANFVVGLFSLVGEGGKVQNVGIADSYLCGGNNVGAVVGNNYGTVTDCSNTSIVSGSSYVGGVVCANGGTVTNCYNTGTVSGSDNSVGGVVGINHGTLTGCYNTGTVSGTTYVGGVVGSNDGTVTGCYNTGTVSGSSNVGGVVGHNEDTVTGCYNTGTGTVSGSSNVGGVVGHNWTAVTNCYNTGSVSGERWVGGVAGTNRTAVTNCYNTGTVSGTTNIGGVVGYNISDTVTVTNCYFDSTVYTGNAIGNDSGTATNVEGKSTAQFAGGEVAYLLSQGENGSIWGQDLDNGKPVQTTPTFNGAKVYCGYTSCGDTVAKYTNDETISAEKPDHTQKPTFTDNGDGTHSAFYSCCGTTVTEDHTGGTATCKEQAKCEHCGASYGEVDSDNHELDENGKCNDCKTQFVACTAIDGEVKYYETLNDAFYAVENCSAEDNAVVQLLSDIALGSSRGYIYSGEFTFDLAGHKITAEHVALEISGNSEANPVVILTDSSEAQTGGLYIEKEGGPEPGYQYVAVSVFQATVTIEKGTYSTDGLGGNPVVVSMGDVTVNGGTFYGLVGADYQGSMDIYGGTFINTEDYGCCVNSGFEANVNIYDGEFTSSGYDSRALASISGTLTVYGGTFTAETCLTANDKNITLKIAEGKTEGAKFINGLKAYYSIDGVTLADSLAEGVAYWQGDKMVVLTEGQTEITDGDVVIKAECPHESYSDGACDVCGAECTHDNQTGAVCEICGAELHICDFSGEWKYDADKHWKECDCGLISEESEHSFTDGKCDCGYTCPHEWGEGVLTRPIRITTTEWDDGYYTYTCSLCGHYYQETVKRADYAAYDAVSDDYYAIIMNSSVLGSVKDALKDAVDSLYQNHADVMAGDRIESEQEAVDKVVAEFEKLVSDAEEKIASGEYVKGDYTAIDEAIDDIEEKLASENVTDEGKAELEEIKKQLEEMKADENTSKADLAELEKALEDYEEELDKGIEDGTLVKVDVDAIADDVNKKWAEKLEAEGLTDEYKDFIDNQKATDEALAAEKEINEFLASLEGTVAENAENIAKLNEMLNSYTASFENCLRGTHNFNDYEVTSPAKCEVNAIETSTCWFCGETDEREVEGTALSHSFTKYEETEAPKCGVAGKEVATCDNGCGATDEKEIPALEHVFIDYASNGDATCTSDGTKTASCIYGCGATDTVADEGSKLPHVDEDGDKLCDDCGSEVVDICPDCGLRAHEDTGVPEYICLLITFIRLIVPFIKTVIAVL